MEKKHGGFWKGLLIFGIGAAAGYLTAKNLKIELTESEEDDWFHEPEDACDDAGCCSHEPKAGEKTADAPDDDDPDSEELKF